MGLYLFPIVSKGIVVYSSAKQYSVLAVMMGEISTPIFINEPYIGISIRSGDYYGQKRLFICFSTKMEVKLEHIQIHYNIPDAFIDKFRCFK